MNKKAVSKVYFAIKEETSTVSGKNIKVIISSFNSLKISIWLF